MEVTRRVGKTVLRVREGQAGGGGSVRLGILRSRAVKVARCMEDAGVRAVPLAEYRDVPDGVGSIARWCRPQARREEAKEDRRPQTLRVPCGS